MILSIDIHVIEINLSVHPTWFGLGQLNFQLISDPLRYSHFGRNHLNRHHLWYESYLAIHWKPTDEPLAI
jgi:hypothetical protein